MTKHTVFISYHHADDWCYSEELRRVNRCSDIFIDKSLDTSSIPDDLEDQKIRQRIRDDYLRDSSVTILLVGQKTRFRKHVDWEIYSSMHDGQKNKKSGILVIYLPTANQPEWYCVEPRPLVARAIYPDCSWFTVGEHSQYQRVFPNMPDRIIDQLLEPSAFVSVAPWCKAINPNNLKILINAAFEDRQKCSYVLRRPMMRENIDRELGL